MAYLRSTPDFSRHLHLLICLAIAGAWLHGNPALAQSGPSSASAISLDPASGFDAKASASGEEYPLGGLLTGVVGYGELLWKDGSPQGDSSFWKYGYVRPEIEWKTTAVTNRITGVFEFYPISILGLSGGGGVDFRNYNSFSGIDCAKYMCNEALTFKFVQGQMIAGVGKFVGIATARYDWIHAQSASKEFYDYMSYLMGRAGDDDLRGLTLLALYRHNPTWSYGALAEYQEMIHSLSHNGEIYGVASYTAGPWMLTAGLGEYESDHQAQRPSAIFLLQYLLKPSIGLIH